MIPLLVISSLVGWTVALAYYIRMKEAEKQNQNMAIELYHTLREWNEQYWISRTYAAHIRSIESQLRQEIDGADWWRNQ